MKNLFLFCISVILTVKLKIDNFRYVIHQDQTLLSNPLPKGVNLQTSNNCVSIINFNNKLFIGFRSAPYHFASDKTHIYILSSDDDGKTWELENDIYLQSDMREP